MDRISVRRKSVCISVQSKDLKVAEGPLQNSMRLQFKEPIEHSSFDSLIVVDEGTPKEPHFFERRGFEKGIDLYDLNKIGNAILKQYIEIHAAERASRSILLQNVEKTEKRISLMNNHNLKIPNIYFMLQLLQKQLSVQNIRLVIFDKEIPSDASALKQFQFNKCLNTFNLSILSSNVNILKFHLYLKEDPIQQMDLTSMGNQKAVLNKFKLL